MGKFEDLHEAIESDVFQPADDEERASRDENWMKENPGWASLKGNLNATAKEICRLVQTEDLDTVKKFLMSPIVRGITYKEDLVDEIGNIITEEQDNWTVQQLLQLQWMLNAGKIPLGGFREDV